MGGTSRCPSFCGAGIVISRILFLNSASEIELMFFER